MRFLSYLTTLLVVVLLAGCGGGGGSAGSNPNRPTIFTTAPDKLTLPIGVVREYSVSGGVAPYSVGSDNSRIVSASLRGDVLLVNTVGQGAANITIRDNNGASASIAVTVGNPLQLSMTTVQSFVGDTVKVSITGGTPPYRTSTLDRAVTAVINQNELVMTLNVVGVVDVVVLDALDQQVKVAVTIINGTPQIRLSPGAVTVSENDTQPIIFTVFTASAGPITVRSSNPTLLQASISGKTVTVDTGSNGDRCVAADTNVTIEVVDASGAFASSSVTIANNPGGCGGFTASSSAVTIFVGQSVEVVLSGVADSGYSVTSSDPRVATAKYAAGVLTITSPTPPVTVPPTPGVTGATTITVTDIAHPARSVTIAVSVN